MVLANLFLSTKFSVRCSTLMCYYYVIFCNLTCMLGISGVRWCRRYRRLTGTVSTGLVIVSMLSSDSLHTGTVSTDTFSTGILSCTMLVSTATLSSSSLSTWPKTLLQLWKRLQPVQLLRLHSARRNTMAKLLMAQEKHAVKMRILALKEQMLKQKVGEE